MDGFGFRWGAAVGLGFLVVLLSGCSAGQSNQEGSSGATTSAAAPADASAATQPADGDPATTDPEDRPSAGLLAALIADPFADPMIRNDQDPCVNTTVGTTLGLERLDELGITPEQPDLLAVSAQLTDDEIDRLTNALDGCDLTAQLTRAVARTEEQIAGCVVSELINLETTDSTMERVRTQLVGDLFLAIEITTRPPLADPVGICADRAVDSLFDDPIELEEYDAAVVSAIAEEFWNGDSEYERRCLTRGMRASVSAEAAQTIDRRFEEMRDDIPPSPGDEEIIAEVFRTGADVQTVCVRPWIRIRTDLENAGVSSTTFGCVRSELDPEILTTTVENYGPALWGGGADASLLVLDGFGHVADTVASCGGPGDELAWQRYVDSVFPTT